MKLQANATLAFVLFSVGTMLGQVPAHNAGLINEGLIPVPNWTTTGPNQASFDLSSFKSAAQAFQQIWLDQCS